MLKKLLISTLFTATIIAQNRGEYQQQLEQFNLFKSQQQISFSDYKAAQEEAYSDYKKKLAKIWQNPRLSTKKTLVTYSKNRKNRTIVDFDKESIIIESIASSKKQAEENLKTSLAKMVTIDTKKLQESDPLAVKLSKIPKPKNLLTSHVDAKPILAPLIFQQKPTQKSVFNYVNDSFKKNKIVVKKSPKIEDKKIYSIHVKLPKNSTIKMSQIYYSDVKKHSLRQNIPLPLVFAIMHTESCFNPRARSNIPAFGLMQIVPKSAGRDSYRFLYHQDKLVSGAYLYNSTNNITLGTAYLHLLYYRYLKNIKNPQSRLYCTIAAYNTGAGNVAWAFTKNHNITQASKLINKLSAKEVYAKLLKNLKYEEPKKYLQNVSKRMKIYTTIYTL